MLIKGIFFDLDNTIWDFSRSASRALDLVYQYYLRDKTEDKTAWLASYKKHNDDLWQAYRDGRETAEKVKYLRFLHSFSAMGVEMDLAEVQEVSSFFLKAIVDNTVLFPLTKETLLLLKEHYILGVITNGFAASPKRLDTLGLNDLFTVFMTAEEAGKPKPDSNIFLRAVSMAGLFPHEVVYVGDDYESDIVGAKAAGLRAVLFNHKEQEVSTVLQSQPDHIIGNISELIDIFLPRAE